jgi:RHS repeat-associated protein
MLNRVIGVNVYDPTNTQIAGTSYSYDGYGSIVGYSQQSSAPGHLSNYDGTYTLRGNATTVTRLTNVAQGTSTSRSATYDVFGNHVTINLDCCNQKGFTYNEDTYWSQPDQTTSGSGGTTLTNNASYNFNTSATVSRTDPNGLTTNYTNNSWLQPTQISPPSGASFGLGYGDWGGLTSSSMSYSDGGVNKSFSASVTNDGWGSPIQQADPAGNKINSTYDNMGRLLARTNPFPGNGTPGPATAYQYDTLGRITKITQPDSNTLQNAYSGSTVTATDQVGRQTQRQLDGLGRLVTVLEQDPAAGGTPSVATNYTYDYLDNLTQASQGGQIRAWKYDAAKRMLYERIPEQSATINDGTGTLWSCAYTCNSFDAIATKTDARGVVTTYGYDAMNRLTSISYNTSNAPGVASTANVTYNYDTSTTSTTKGLLLSVAAAGAVQESYAYDSLNRPSSVTDVIDGRSYTKSYQYNQASQATQITYPSQRVLPLGFDSYGRPSSVGSYLSGIAYNAAGLTTGWTLGNGVTQSFGYDAQRLEVTSEAATKGSTTLMNLTLGYQATAGQMGAGTTAGNTGGMVSLSGTINGATESAGYSYDLLGRLATSSQSTNGLSAQRRFAYDRYGNRTGVWDSTSGGNQIQNASLQQSGGVPTNGLATISSAGESVYNTLGQCGTLTAVNVGRTGRYVRVQLMGTNYLNLAEVQVIGSSGQNLALAGTASQSSTAFGGTANRANDGNTDGNFADGSVSHTDYQNQPWWQVDLGSSQQVSSVNVWNRTDCCQSRTTNFNVIVSDQPITTLGYIYDASGNVTYDGMHSYQYDAENRLTSVDGGSTTYAYDYAGHRVKKVSGGVTTHYIYEGGLVSAEHNGSTGAVAADYIFARGIMIAKEPAGSPTRYFLGDRLSGRLSADSSGNVVGRQAHLPFGEEYGESGEQGKHHFTNYESDSESGLDHAMNRQYSQAVGKFMSSDSYRASGYLVNPQSWNRYSYTGNDPVNRADTTGLESSNPPSPPPPPEFPSMNVLPPGQFYSPMVPPLPTITVPPPVSQGGGGPHRAGNADERLKAFLKNHDHCKDYINSRIGAGRKQLDELFESTSFEDWRDFQNKSLLELKIATFDITSNFWTPTNPLGTYLGPGSPTYAVDSQDHHVYLGWAYFVALKDDPDAQGETILHELLHEAFGSHIDVADNLGLRDGNGEKYTDDSAASQAINDFLNGNCN